MQNIIDSIKENYIIKYCQVTHNYTDQVEIEVLAEAEDTRDNELDDWSKCFHVAFFQEAIQEVDKKWKSDYETRLNYSKREVTLWDDRHPTDPNTIAYKVTMTFPKNKLPLDEVAFSVHSALDL